MSFVLRLDPKKRAAGRFIGRVRDELVKAFLEAKAERGITQRFLAEESGIDPGRVSRILNGEENLTLRSVAEIATVLDREIDFVLRRTANRSQRSSPSSGRPIGQVEAWGSEMKTTVEKPTLQFAQ